MTTSLTDTNNSKSWDWRIIIGMLISTIWLLVLFFFLFQKMTWQQFLDLPLDQIDGFLSGAFSPLAFVWLIIGFFIQQGEIAENARNIERQEQHSNLDNFLKKSNIIYKHLGVITGFLYLSCREEIQESLNKEIDIDDLWTRSGRDDPGIFARGLSRYRFYEDGTQRNMKSIFFGTEIRHNHVKNYQRIFSDLLKDAKESDCTGSLYDAINEGTVWGILNRVICETQAVQEISNKDMPAS